MENLKTEFKYSTTCEISRMDNDVATTNSYVKVFALDTSKHPAFAMQLLNTGNTNTLSVKVETTFDNVNFTEVKAETDIAANGNLLFEDESIGTKTIVSVKSKVAGSHTTFNLWTRLKPGATIV